MTDAQAVEGNQSTNATMTTINTTVSMTGTPAMDNSTTTIPCTQKRFSFVHVITVIFYVDSLHQNATLLTFHAFQSSNSSNL